MLPILALSTPMCLRTLNYERAIVLKTAGITQNISLRTLNYERAIVLCMKTNINNPVSQNPQLREGYCAGLAEVTMAS